VRTPQRDDTHKELEAIQKRFEQAKKENFGLQEEIEIQKKHVVTLEGQIRRLENSDVEPDRNPTPLHPSSEPEPDPSEVNHRQYTDLQEDHRELQDSFAKKESEVKALNEEMTKLLANFENVADRSSKAVKKFKAPSSISAQTREYEQKLSANELLIQGLRSELERAQLAVEEYKDEMQRQRGRRRRFEEEMAEERQILRDQIQQLKIILAGENRDNLSLEDLEQMESEDLLTYIEDVETEKLRALAGLEALDAQEESYRKQLDAQQEELKNIQTDLDRFKESNLATEMEDTEKTITAQRDQLETLLGFSKTLKAQVTHLKERQEPLRVLIERLNQQEKALIRYIRINHDRSFMPKEAYDKHLDSK
jgi:chromosome segregation ATPase